VNVGQSGERAEVLHEILGHVEIAEVPHPGDEGDVGDVVVVDIEKGEVGEGGQHIRVGGRVVLHREIREVQGEVGERREVGERIVVDVESGEVGQVPQEAEIADAATVQEEIVQIGEIAELPEIGDVVAAEVEGIKVQGCFQSGDAGDARVIQREIGEAGHVREGDGATGNTELGANGGFDVRVGEDYGGNDAQVSVIAVDPAGIIGDNHEIVRTVRGGEIGDGEGVALRAVDAHVVHQGHAVGIPLIKEVGRSAGSGCHSEGGGVAGGKDQVGGLRGDDGRRILRGVSEADAAAEETGDDVHRL